MSHAIGIGEGAIDKALDLRITVGKVSRDRGSLHRHLHPHRHRHLVSRPLLLKDARPRTPPTRHPLDRAPPLPPAPQIPPSRPSTRAHRRPPPPAPPPPAHEGQPDVRPRQPPCDD